MSPIAKQLYDFFDSTEKWTQQAFARNAAGLGIDPFDPSATCWCLLGAAEKLNLTCPPDLSWQEFINRFHKVTTTSMVAFNDTTNFNTLKKTLNEL